MRLSNTIVFLLNSSWYFNVFLSSLLVYGVACHECYVCGVGDNEPISCAEFNGSYKETCPHGVTSCGLQMFGDKVIARTCGEPGNLTDCQVANKIKYCYCASNLCNGNINLGFETDDEDLTENGSGYDTTSTTFETTSVEITTLKPKSNDSNKLRVTVVLFLYFLVFI